MRQAILTRKQSLPDQDIFGDLVTDSKWSCVTGELPWRNNATDKSCIPTGTYLAKWLWSEKHGCYLYHLVNVPGRNQVEIHAANVPTLQLLGCIAPGMEIITFTKGTNLSHNLDKPVILDRDYLGVTASVTALGMLEKDMRDNNNGPQLDFELTIKE